MTRKTISPFVCAGILALLFACTEGYEPWNKYRPRKQTRIDIATPEEYQKLLDGFYNKYPFICVESGAHDDVLGEAKRWADSKIHQQLRFIDEDNNMIVVNPRTKSVTGNFKRGKLFNNLPNDYKSYTIVVQHDAVITREDQSVMGEWPFYADVLVSHLSDWVA